jgi:hypothetical protein
MIDRNFNEAELREMLEDASHVEPNEIAGRFDVSARLGRKNWIVVVEPDPSVKRLLIITAYTV